jgi:hypothetical protein
MTNTPPINAVQQKVCKMKRKKHPVFVYNKHFGVLHFIFNCGKAVSVKYFACVSVALVIHHAQRLHHNVFF